MFTWLHKPSNEMIDKKGYISVLDDDDIWGPQYEGVDLSRDEDLFGGEENALHGGGTNGGDDSRGRGDQSALRQRTNSNVVVTDVSDDQHAHTVGGDVHTSSGGHADTVGGDKHRTRRREQFGDGVPPSAFCC